MRTERGICGGCGRPVWSDEDHVVAEPQWKVRAVDGTEVPMQGSAQPFHRDHVPGGRRWRITTSTTPGR